jgi:hypothetical protein
MPRSMPKLVLHLAGIANSGSRCCCGGIFETHLRELLQKAYNLLWDFRRFSLLDPQSLRLAICVLLCLLGALQQLPIRKCQGKLVEKP